MALTAQKLSVPDHIPPGNFASKLIRAIHEDSRQNILPRHTVYSASHLSAHAKRSKAMDVKVFLPLEHPLEGRNNPQPSKVNYLQCITVLIRCYYHDRPDSGTETGQDLFTALYKFISGGNDDAFGNTIFPQGFMDWKVPTRFSETGSSRGQSRQSVRSSKSRQQHGLTQTTHFAPPHGKFEPIKSEQQEHMAEVERRESAIRKHLLAKSAKLPNIAKSAPIRKKPETPLDLEPRTYSAAQRWLKHNPGEEQLARKVLRQTGRSEVDKLLANTMQPNAKKAVREWLRHASESERQAALNFFRSIAGAQLLSGPAGSHPDSNREGDRYARLRAVLEALTEKQGEPTAIHSQMDRDIKSLMKAAHRRHLRLLTPDTRSRHREFQTWHHMPLYPVIGRADNVLSMYTRPSHAPPRSFKIHPEWGA